MRIGLVLENFTWPGSPVSIGRTFERVVDTAEQTGFDSLWTIDHFFQIPANGPPEREMLEGYAALAFAAGRTERMELGMLVTAVTHRHPGVLLKTVTTLDVLSCGRAWLGIGAAWNEQEHVGLGIPFPPLKERFERLEETLQIAHRMMAGDQSLFEGAHYRLERPLNSPRPVRRPHLPILVGGGGEKKTLRLVARYADACNLSDALGTQTLRHKLDVLKGHCEEAGRDYGEIEKTVYSKLALSRDGLADTWTPGQAVERFHALAEEGIDHAIVSLPNIHEKGVLDLVAKEVLPAVKNLLPAGRSPDTS